MQNREHFEVSRSTCAIRNHHVFGIIAFVVSVFQGEDAQQVVAETMARTFSNTLIITVMLFIGGVGGTTGLIQIKLSKMLGSGFDQPRHC